MLLGFTEETVGASVASITEEEKNNKCRLDVRKGSGPQPGSSLGSESQSKATGPLKALRLATQTLRDEEGGGSDGVYLLTQINATRHTTGKQLASRRLKSAVWRAPKDAAAFIPASSGNKRGCSQKLKQAE